ncbi:MAG: PadR family transcriptional regulator [Actinomycetota bacterium]
MDTEASAAPGAGAIPDATGPGEDGSEFRFPEGAPFGGPFHGERGWHPAGAHRARRHHEDFPPSGFGWGMWDNPGRGFGRGRGGPGGHRARRGDVQSGILGVLADGPMHGYELIREMEARSGGAWHPSPGSVYPHLQLFQDSGFVTSEERDGKRIYSITDAGREKLAEYLAQTGSPWEFAREGAREGRERFGKLFKEMSQLGAAAMQVARTGSPEQVQKVAEVLSEARKKVYGLLAED